MRLIFIHRIRALYFVLLIVNALLVEVCFSQTLNTIPDEAKKSIEEFIAKGIEAENANDYNQASFCYHQAGNTYWTHGYLNESVDQYKKALSMSEKLASLNGIAVLNTKIGLLYTELKNFDASLAYFSKSLDIARKMARKQDVVSSLLNVANSYNELERFNESLPFLNEAEAIAKDLNDTKLLRNCYSLMTRIYDKLGEREKSTQYFNLFAAISKGIQLQEMAKKESEAKLMVEQANTKVQEVQLVKEATEQELQQKKQELQVNQQNLTKVEQLTKEQQMQIDLQKKEKALMQAELEQQLLMRKIYIGIILTVLAIALLTYFGYQKIKKQNYLLSAKNIEISKQKDEIEKQAEELRNLNALKDKLFSIISHDLRSPLASLITILNMAREGHITTEESKSFILELSRNVEYNTELLENLLKWASTQLKGNVINPVNFDISEVILNKTKLYEKAAKQKGVEIIDKSVKDTLVYADRDMVEIVVRNLITNAIKFSDNGNSVTIDLSRENGLVKVCVSDTGRGISKESIGKLFGKQVFSTRGTQNEKGTGLGLILCRDFVQINGGEIWVESQENIGSNFYFTLPSKKN